MNRAEALKLIQKHLDPTQLDEPAILEIGQAVSEWLKRQDEAALAEQLHVVWSCSDGVFTQASYPSTHQHAYREWYRLTDGGKKNRTLSDRPYFFVAKASWTPDDKHPLIDDESDSLWE